MRRRALMILTLVALFVAASTSAIRAADKNISENKTGAPITEASPQKTQAYLGLAIEPLHRSLISHLLDLLGDGRGVLVSEVAADSPAEQAGVKQDDILVSYDDQKLYSPEQLVKLVQNDKPGREVTLEVIHAGKSEKMTVTLGERPFSVAAEEPSPSARRRSFSGRGLRPPTPEERDARWATFDAMTLSRIDDDHFKAEIRFRDDEGQLETHTFQGTRAELRKDIESEKHLPASEHNHLLRALDMARHPFEFDFPGIRFAPPADVLWDFEELNR